MDYDSSTDQCYLSSAGSMPVPIPEFMLVESLGTALVAFSIFAVACKKSNKVRTAFRL